MKTIELLAPAGDLEKLKTAVDFGADAVYFGGRQFSLRAGAGNLTTEEIREGTEYAHRFGKKAYLTLNIFARSGDLQPMEDWLNRLKDIPLDACVVSDPGVAELVRRVLPEAELHLSTQAGLTNYAAAGFWHRQGFRRIVPARELSLAEIRQLRDAIPGDMEIEAFVQGAMCISYSGRCLLSSVMTGRDANRGACAHPCRWQYSLMEEKRPGEYFPVEEDGRGTYILNSRDLCMLEHLPALAEAGVTSFKIEGRMKSMFYVATVVGAYRKALDDYLASPEKYVFRPEYMDELKKASHREFTTGFYFQPEGTPPGRETQNPRSSAYEREYTFLGVVKEYDPGTATALVEQRNKMVRGDEIEVFGPGRDFFTQTLRFLEDEEGRPLEDAPHPKQRVRIPLDQPAEPGFLLRKR